MSASSAGTENSTEKPFELFELLAACLMGLGAVGAALAGYQSGLWGGSMTDAYGEAAATTTKAAATYSDELASYIQDSQSSMRAKELVWTAVDSEDAEQRERNFEMASWIFLSQLSEPAYAALKLPAATKQAYETNGDQVFSESELKQALELDLDETEVYEQTLFAGSAEQFKQAAAFTEKARSANSTGDQFALAGLIMTVGLFFAGLALVFKTGIRWGFLGAGGAVFAGGLAYMLMQPFA
jgi:hypothetical protein